MEEEEELKREEEYCHYCGDPTRYKHDCGDLPLCPQCEAEHAGEVCPECGETIGSGESGEEEMRL